MNDSLRSSTIKMEEKEEDFRSLKKKTAEFPFVYEDCLRSINSQKEVWEEILKFSKGTDSERQVYQKIEMLENKSQEMRQLFSYAEEEVELKLKSKQQAFDTAEELYEELRKEANNED